jgi:peptidoglycan/LPS O-acetylase OafA/YrhL
VIGYHWLFKGIETGTLTTLSYSSVSGIAAYGYLGVHLFFMISGFVIAASAQGRTASQFAVRRLVRLYPAFWVAVLVTALVTVFWGAPVLHVTIPEVLANLTMIPSVLNQPMVDRSYWTLLCEIIFYGMVFMLLIAGLGRRLEVFFPAWAVLMAVVSVLAPQLAAVPLLGTLYAFFAGGAIISTIQRHGWRWWQAIGLVASFYLAIRYIIADTNRINDGQNGPFVQSVPLTVAIVCAFFVLLLVQITPQASAWVIPKSALLGALTFPVYLLHAHLGYMLFNQFANDGNKWVVYPIALALVLVLAYGVHVLVERRPKRMWMLLFDRTVGVAVRWIEGMPSPRSRRSVREEPPTVETLKSSA